MSWPSRKTCCPGSWACPLPLGSFDCHHGGAALRAVLCSAGLVLLYSFGRQSEPLRDPGEEGNGLIPDSQLILLSLCPAGARAGASPQNLLWVASLPEQDPVVTRTLDPVLEGLDSLEEFPPTVVCVPGPKCKEGA